jgi:hypothetical protein
MDEMNQKEDFDPKKDFLLRSRTCLGGLPNKSRKPYWNPVKRPDISDDQTDSPVCKIRYSSFDRMKN